MQKTVMNYKYYKRMKELLDKRNAKPEFHALTYIFGTLRRYE